MKTWRDLSSVAVPENIKALPTDARGYQIPWTVLIDDNGKPDFRVIDERKAAAAITDRICSICGKQMGEHVAFVGGPKSMQSRMFIDGPMHELCAVYAAQVCPFIAAPKFGYISKHKEHEGYDLAVIKAVSNDRPDVFGVGVTDVFGLRMFDGAGVVIVAGEWLKVRWFKHGEEVAHVEG